jgi:predicted small secreted protein
MLPRRLRVTLVLASALLLAGCFDRFPQLALFPHSQFVTTADVDLRSDQADESEVVAHLAKGTVVVPIGQVGSHSTAACWRVNTPQGVGWLYTAYLAPLPHPDE